MAKGEKLTCEWCGQKFDRRSNRGPTPKFCSNAHRQAAHRSASSGGLDPAILNLDNLFDPAILNLDNLDNLFDPAILNLDNPAEVTIGTSGDAKAKPLSTHETAAMQALLLAIISLVGKDQAWLLTHAALKGAWTLWVLMWQLRNSSPSADLFIVLGAVLIRSAYRRLSQKPPATTN